MTRLKELVLRLSQFTSPAATLKMKSTSNVLILVTIARAMFWRGVMVPLLVGVSTCLMGQASARSEVGVRLRMKMTLSRRSTLFYCGIIIRCEPMLLTFHHNYESFGVDGSMQ